MRKTFKPLSSMKCLNLLHPFTVDQNTVESPYNMINTELWRKSNDIKNVSEDIGKK